MAGVLNRSVAKSGATAYQDHLDPQKFHYMPNRIDSILGETIRDFGVEYYGIGADAFYKNVDGVMKNVSGGVVHGQVVPDITPTQRADLLDEINKAYGIEAYLVPLNVDNAAVQPVFANAVAAEGQGSSSTFPSTFQFSSSFNFAIASGNSLFPQLVAVLNSEKEEDVGSFIGANFTGTTKLYGDPWKAHIRADLSQVWDYVRSKGEATLSAGWLNFGAAWDDVAQELKRNSIIEMDFIEGSGGAEFGRNMLEATRKVFEAINAQITAGEGMFRFEPNTTPEAPKSEGSWGSSLLPYGVGVNLSFASNSFEQSIIFEETVSFTGFVDLPLMTSMNLSAVCDRKTVGMFLDVQTGKNSCITPEIMKGWNERAKNELRAKKKVIDDLYQMFIGKVITFKEYQEQLAWINLQTWSDPADREGNRISLDQARANFNSLIERAVLKRRR